MDSRCSINAWMVTIASALACNAPTKMSGILVAVDKKVVMVVHS